MRLLLLALISLWFVSGVGYAGAADSTGWSVGISGGLGTGTSSQSDENPIICKICDGGDGTIRMSGGLFGGGVGYNFWQLGPWVVGVAGDYSWADISGTAVCGPNGAAIHACGTTLQSLGTFRGNIGPYWLVYGTAGYAGGELHGWDALMQGSGTSLLSGWTAGAGIQTFITQSLTFKFEYLR